MRVIGGRWRGRRLQAPRGRETRPTSDRVREAIFSSVYSILGDLAGRAVLDLYAGSGALGIEALSRGASSCIFVESERSAIRLITENLRSLEAERGAGEVVQAQVRPSLAERLGSVEASLLLADPPYRIDPLEFGQVLEALAASDALQAGALVVYEHSSRTTALWPRGFRPIAERHYGDTAVSFATYEGDFG